MRLSNGLREFVESRNSRGVEYVIVGRCFPNKVAAELDGIPVFILGREALVRNKRAVGRPQDLADLEALAD